MNIIEASDIASSERKNKSVMKIVRKGVWYTVTVILFLFCVRTFT